MILLQFNLHSSKKKLVVLPPYRADEFECPEATVLE